MLSSKSFIIAIILIIFITVQCNGEWKDINSNLTVISYDENTVITQNTTLTAGWIKAHLSQYGGDNNTIQYECCDNLDNISAKVYGVPLKEITDQVGGVDKKGWIKLSSQDGNFVNLPPVAIYHTPAGIGTAVLAYNVSSDIPTNDGYQLFFINQKGIFTTDEMISVFPEVYWGYSDTKNGTLPSACGLYLKDINKVEVFSPSYAEWNLIIIGKSARVISSDEFSDILSGQTVNWTDSDKALWSGIPLYRLAGLVDDENPDTFNTDLANRGYNIILTSSDGDEVNLTSGQIAYNDRIFIANKIGDGQIMPKFGDFPLKLAGSDLKPEEQIGGIIKIYLRFPI